MGRGRFEKERDRDEAREALRRAADRRDLAGIRRAVLAGAEVDCVDLDGQSALISLSGRSSGGECVKELLRLGADIEQMSDRGRTPLITAICSGSTQAGEILLAAGADPNREDEQGATPLAWALLTRSGDLARALLNAGARAPEAGEPLSSWETGEEVGGLIETALRCGADVALMVLRLCAERGDAPESGLLRALAAHHEEGPQMAELIEAALRWLPRDEIVKVDRRGQTASERAAERRRPGSDAAAQLFAAQERFELEKGGAAGRPSKGARL